MPYCKDYSHPKKDDVVWGNTNVLPPERQFDTANPPEGLLCTFGDDDHQEVAAGYIFDPLIGWNLACYDHCMICLDSDLYNDNHFRPGPAQVEAPRETGRERLEREKKAVPEGAMCDNPHDELDDAPPAQVGVFKTRKGAKDPVKFYCDTCAFSFVRKCLVVDECEFEPFEMVPAGKKE